ncbi:MAG: CmpA/NrtA family ABC transporter substrate-binding protein [Alphaproteobacteria bacterium]
MSGKRDLIPVRAGFIPLLDAATLIIAREKSFAEEQGIALELIRETSWANIRDRVAIGHFDVAHMLAPLPIAVSLGLAPLTVAMIAPMSLGLGGNAITVSSEIWSEMKLSGAPSNGDPSAAGAALCAVMKTRARAGRRALKFGIVHPFSSHNYELRYWLSATASGQEAEFVVLPPPLMADALASGGIDGYCVGEPWNTAAVSAGSGRIVTTKTAIWKSSPEKVLGLREEWAEQNPDRLSALIRALHAAALWCDEPRNHAELAHILSARAYLDQPTELLLPGLSGRLKIGDELMPVADFLRFEKGGANYPRVEHALWFLSQMARWGQTKLTEEAIAKTRATYRADLYLSALGPTAAAGAKAQSAFFDGKRFDPDQLQDYVASFSRLPPVFERG